MPRRHEIKSLALSQIMKGAELERFVAFDARIRRQPSKVGTAKGLNHRIVEDRAEIAHLVLDAQTITHRSRIENRLIVTIRRLGASILFEQAHSHAHDTIPLLLEEHRGSGTIDTAAHGAQHATLNISTIDDRAH